MKNLILFTSLIFLSSCTIKNQKTEKRDSYLVNNENDLVLADLSFEKENTLANLYCINNGSAKDANFIGEGTGRALTIRFTESNWSGVRNTCGNYVPANQRRNGRIFTFPDRNLYQYQMVLFEDGPGVRNYFTNICEEDKNYTVQTKRGFKYYVYTNDTSGDHGDNNGYISFCYQFQ